MVKRYLLVAVIFFNTYSIASSQDKAYATEVINELCAPNMHGRGYVNKGEKLAAEYIGSQFKALGLSSFDKTFYQKFKINVNTFPSSMEVLFDKKILAPGKDYHIDPCAPSIKGNFKVTRLSTKELLDINSLRAKLSKTKGHFLLINAADFADQSKEEISKIHQIIQQLKSSTDIPSVGIILVSKDKLTWSVTGEVCAKPLIIVKESKELAEPKMVQLNINNRYIKAYDTQNIIGTIPGTKYPDSIVIFSAHYDHLGRMGNDTFFPGANDNASGTALLLDLARHYSNPVNAPEFALVFIAFGAEEIGLLGSKHFVENPLFPLTKIKFLINLDIAGSGDEGITVVNGKIHLKAFELLEKINFQNHYLPQVKSRGEACNSDHCLFHLNNVPSFFIYTLGGVTAYHDIYDIPETLPLTKYEGLFKLVRDFVSSIDAIP